MRVLSWLIFIEAVCLMGPFYVEPLIPTFVIFGVAWSLLEAKWKTSARGSS